MNIKIKFVVLFLLQIFISTYAQEDSVKVQNAADKVFLNIKLRPIPFTLEGESLKKLEFVNHMDESSPGSPDLPSKTFFIAIPPESKVNLKINNIKTEILQNVQPEANPKVFLKDTIMYYSKSQINPKYSSSDIYPVNICEIIGYTWLRGYYCVAIRVNQYCYKWKERSLIELISVQVEMNLESVKPFVHSTVSSQYFNSTLQKEIVNFKTADQYRSHRIYSINDSSDNWIDYNSEYVKLNLLRDGIYRITYSDLVNYGIDPSSINPLKLKIFEKGTEIPLYVFGENDLSFDQGDYIEFYATKNYSGEDYHEIVATGEDYKNYMDRYSDTTTIWLNWNGSNGKRIFIQNSGPSGISDTLQSHIAFNHFENDQRLWYYDAVQPRVQLPFWQENKVWTWLVQGQSGSSSINATCSDIVPNKLVYITSRLISYSADNIVTNAHRFGMSINSTTPQDTIVFNFKQTVNFSSQYNSNQLSSGNNIIRIFGLPNDASVFHQALIDWVDFDYERYNVAVNDSLLIRVGSGYQENLRIIKVENVTVPQSQMLVYKIKPNLKQIKFFTLTGSVLTFADTVSSDDEYFIINGNSTLEPIFVKKKMFEDLRNQTSGADEIIISNKLLQNSVNAYYNFINSNYNLSTKLIYVDDIFDEFSYGYNKPEAIKNFLEYAYSNWPAPAPSYLLLIGDANYDYKKKTTPPPVVDRKNLVPSYGFPVSDTWFTMWDSTNINLPQMYVGRIPAETNDEVMRYFK